MKFGYFFESLLRKYEMKRILIEKESYKMKDKMK